MAYPPIAAITSGTRTARRRRHALSPAMAALWGIDPSYYSPQPSAPLSPVEPAAPSGAEVAVPPSAAPSRPGPSRRAVAPPSPYTPVPLPTRDRAQEGRSVGQALPLVAALGALLGGGTRGALAAASGYAQGSMSRADREFQERMTQAQAQDEAAQVAAQQDLSRFGREQAAANQEFDDAQRALDTARRLDIQEEEAADRAAYRAAMLAASQQGAADRAAASEARTATTAEAARRKATTTEAENLQRRVDRALQGWASAKTAAAAEVFAQQLDNLKRFRGVGPGRPAQAWQPPARATGGGSGGADGELRKPPAYTVQNGVSQEEFDALKQAGFNMAGVRVVKQAGEKLPTGTFIASNVTRLNNLLAEKAKLSGATEKKLRTLGFTKETARTRIAQIDQTIASIRTLLPAQYHMRTKEPFRVPTKPTQASLLQAGMHPGKPGSLAPVTVSPENMTPLEKPHHSTAQPRTPAGTFRTGKPKTQKKRPLSEMSDEELLKIMAGGK